MPKQLDYIKSVEVTMADLKKGLERDIQTEFINNCHLKSQRQLDEHLWLNYINENFEVVSISFGKIYLI